MSYPRIVIKTRLLNMIELKKMLYAQHITEIIEEKDTFILSWFIRKGINSSGGLSLIGCTIVRRNIWSKNNNLHYLLIGNTVTQILYGAFEECENLQQIVFNDCQVTELKSHTFRHCSQLKSCILPYTCRIQRMNLGVFQDCVNLRKVTIEGICDLHERVFIHCSQINEIYLSSMVTLFHNTFIHSISNTPETIIEVPSQLYSYFLELVPLASINEKGYLLK